MFGVSLKNKNQIIIQENKFLKEKRPQGFSGKQQGRSM